MWSKKIEQLASENNGELPSILFPCVVIYTDRENNELCWLCAQKDKEEEGIFDTIDYFLSDDREELENLKCSECQKHIDPALRKTNRITEGLEKNGYVDLGRDYASITVCSCDNPQIHSEDKLDWEGEGEEEEEEGKDHYIAMIGMHGGYLPSYCEVFQTEEEAIDDLLYLIDVEEMEG